MEQKQAFYEERVWPEWIKSVKQAPDHLIFLHGAMGSELRDTISGFRRWVDLQTDDDMQKLTFEEPRLEGFEGSVDCDGQCIYAHSLVRAPIVEDPYSRFVANMTPGRFCYDWRESVLIEAKRLQRFLQLVLEQVDEPISFVTHSMGGCLLMYLLGTTREFDEAIHRIIFCAPPFHGALKPIRIIEDGDGLPVDLLVRNFVLRNAAVTMPGLFQLMVAPPDFWVRQPEDGPELQYPVRTERSPYAVTFWNGVSDTKLRAKILHFAKTFHQEMWNNIPAVIDRLGEKINVVVALRGRTAFSVSRSKNGTCKIHKTPEAENGKFSNGDGTVLFQSSILPGLPKERYWADIPSRYKDTHGGIVDSKDVIEAIRKLLKGQKPEKLVPYSEFIHLIDWSYEQVGGRARSLKEHLDYSERAHLRSITPVDKWGSTLNPLGKDALLYYITREAALRVIKGEDINVAAQQIGQEPEFLKEHIKQLLLPML